MEKNVGFGMSLRRQCMLMGSWVTRSLLQSAFSTCFCFLIHNYNYPLPNFLWWADKEGCIWPSESTNDNQIEFFLCSQAFLSGKMQRDDFSHLFFQVNISGSYYWLLGLLAHLNGGGESLLHGEHWSAGRGNAYLYSVYEEGPTVTLSCVLLCHRSISMSKGHQPWWRKSGTHKLSRKDGQSEAPQVIPICVLLPHWVLSVEGTARSPTLQLKYAHSIFIFYMLCML